MRQFLLLAGLLGTLLGCTPTPKPIAYGTDGCHFCRMTIVDRQHAAQLVTDKGKNYKFDAAECMLNFMDENPGQQYAYILVSDYSRPGELIDATGANYLISENLPSPMGANLTSFSSAVSAKKTQEELGGQVFSWEALRKTLKQPR